MYNIPGKRPLPGKRPCTAFQGVNVPAYIQTYGNYVPGKRPCRPKLRCMFKRPWALARDTTVCVVDDELINIVDLQWVVRYILYIHIIPSKVCTCMQYGKFPRDECFYTAYKARDWSITTCIFQPIISMDTFFLALKNFINVCPGPPGTV